ncbi:MAG: ATP-dependent DNA helicase RecG [Bacteroidota bacterium]|nr:ATP-dependent DNA helicase RecG [Bacteroidota bacterium]
MDLDQAIEYLKGVGPVKGALLRKHLKVQTLAELLYIFPFRYLNKTLISKIHELQVDQYAQSKVLVVDLNEKGHGKTKRVIAMGKDESGFLELVWFRAHSWVLKNISPGQHYLIYGKVNYTSGIKNMIHPEMEVWSDETIQKRGLAPIYSSNEELNAKGLDARGRRRIIQSLLDHLKPGMVPENLPEYILKKFNLINRYESLKSIHFPKDQGHLFAAQQRLKFEELFFIQLKMQQAKALRNEMVSGFKMTTVGPIFNQFYTDKLPFTLTNAQKRVLKEIHSDLQSGKQMNRLLQGDVGSGKTIIALMTMLIAIENGFQACIMAPTEILASQHFQSLTELLKDLPISICFLSSNIKGKERDQILEGLGNGSIHLAIGTHALIEDAVVFNNLGLTVIDEQHRFGVEQRSRLWKKSKVNLPHVLVMTATPIPRTLAMSLYGDLDISIIDELPPNRKEIQTKHFRDFQRGHLYNFMKDQIAKSCQVYIVYPLIEESEKLDLENLDMGYEKLLTFFPTPEYRISVVHGRMKSKDKEVEMKRFVSGSSHIMVATTVIEVGVNVPKASVMVIENAERFGLSQLHQLRGRVGRGIDQSYCILMTTDHLGDEAKARIQIMCETNDGFKIAEADLRLRGPGDLEGTRQSGLLELKMANIREDQDILKSAHNIAAAILHKDPKLIHPINLVLKNFLENQGQANLWERIS